MRKNNWIKYYRANGIIEIKVKESNGRVIEKFKFDPANKKDYGRALRMIEKKYNWYPEIKEETKKEDKFLNNKNNQPKWLNLDMDI